VAKLIGEKVDKFWKKLVSELKQNAQDDPETLEQIKGICRGESTFGVYVLY